MARGGASVQGEPLLPLNGSGLPNGLALIVVATVLLAGCQSTPPPSAALVEAEIRAVIERQERDWNDGNVEHFMRGYARAGETRFASGGEVVRGWQTVMDRYLRRYPDRAAMGRLTFSELEITVLASDAALVLGRWQLKRAEDAPSGLFTLLFRKTREGWRIVHDHTSAKEK